jgi:succinoglycan biosynthesis transport protein ExoP
MDHFPLARLREAVLAKRRLLLALLLVGIIGGAMWGALRPRWYAAEVTLAVRRTAALDETNSRPDSADYPTLLANRAVAHDIVTKHHLERWKIDSSRLLELVSIREVRNTSLLLLSVTLPEPELARQVASSFAARATELNRDLNARDVVRARDMIKAQLDEARGALRQSESRLLEHRSTALVELRRSDSKAKLDAREQLVGLTADLEAERNRLVILEGQRKMVPETTPGTRLPAAEQELAEQARQFERTATDRPSGRGQTPDAREQAREQVEREIPAWPRGDGGANPVRQLLEYQVSASRARVAAIEGRLRELTGRHDVDNKVLPDLLALYQGEVQLTRFELERDIAAKAVTDLSAQYEQARLKVASRVTDLQVVDEAIVPNRPVTSGIAVSAVIGLLLGCVGCVLALVPSLVSAVVAADEPRM